MAPIPVGGIATGLDTDTLVQQLLAVERKPITLLQTKQVKLHAVSTAFQDLNSKLAGLKSKVDALKDPATFFSRSATSSADTVAEAAVGPGSATGTYTLTVSGLARGSIATAASTRGALTDTVATADGSVQFRVGTSGPVVTLPVTTTTTLDQLVRAINDTKAGAKASAVNVGTAAAPAYRLTLTTTATGAANDIVILADGTDLGLTKTQTAVDAAFSVSGIGSFTRPSNSFSDVIEGVTVTLKAGTGSTDLAVKVDTGGTQARVQGFIDAYNDVVRTIDGQTSGSKGSDGKLTPGAFTGDAVPRQIRNRLASLIATSVPGGVATLSRIGITTAKNGTLTLDAAAFQKALNDDPDGVSVLFGGTGTTDGVADLLSRALDQATRAVTGTIAVRQDGINATIRSVQAQIDGALARLEGTERTLRARFTNLETVVARLQRTGTALLNSLQSLATPGT